MAASKLVIYNLVLTTLGEDRLSTITDDNEARRKLDAIYDDKLEELLYAGPEKGWKFTKEESVAVSVESSTISSFADYSSTVSGAVSATTSAAHNLISGNNALIDDTSNYNNEYKITKIDSTSFYFTATWNGTETGTAYWISDDDYYRFAIPSAAKRVLKAKVDGIELTDWKEENGYILTRLEDTTIYLDYIKSVTDTTLFPAYFTNAFVSLLKKDLGYPLIKNSAHYERLYTEYQRALSDAIALDEQKKYVKEVSTSWVDAGR